MDFFADDRGCELMMYKKRYIFLFCFSFLLVGTFVMAEEQTIILGREDGWKALTHLDGVSMKQGKWGFLDLVLDHGDYEIDQETDLLLHFNSKPVQTGKRCGCFSRQGRYRDYTSAKLSF